MIGLRRTQSILCMLRRGVKLAAMARGGEGARERCCTGEREGEREREKFSNVELGVPQATSTCCANKEVEVVAVFGIQLHVRVCTHTASQTPHYMYCILM